MMIRKQLIAGIVVLFIGLAATGQTSVNSPKGYDLYSWKIKGRWYYSLLPRSASPRSYAQITASDLVRRDASDLESELSKLAKGEQVYWMGDAPRGATRSATDRAVDFKHPSRKRIKQIKAICDRLGITLKLV